MKVGKIPFRPNCRATPFGPELKDGRKAKYVTLEKNMTRPKDSDARQSSRRSES